MKKNIYNYTRLIKIIISWLTYQLKVTVKYTFAIIQNINKLKQGNYRISKANKIKDIMLINSYVTHNNRYIQYKQNLTSGKAHIYSPYRACRTQHNTLNIHILNFNDNLMTSTLPKLILFAVLIKCRTRTCIII